MHFKVCIVILAAAYITYAGDQFLYIFDEEGEDVENLISRVRRDGEQDDEYEEEFSKHIVTCCNETEVRLRMQEDGDNLKNITSKCQRQTENITQIKERYFCYVECIFEMINMTDENGNTVEDPEQLEQIKEIYFFDHKIILQNIVSKCPVWSEEAVKNVQGQYECNPQAMYFFYCSFDMMNLYCPEELRINNNRCDEHRRNLTKTFQQ